MISAAVLPRWWHRAGLCLAGIAALLVFVFALLPPRDPIVNGAPMSDWVRKLTQRWTSGHGSYGYPRGVRNALFADREAAIAHLIGAVNDRPRALDTFRVKAGKRLPVFLARLVTPDRPLCRWAGVMALSDFAYQQPDPRISAVFLRCMHDPNPIVRKVTAYELGPWIFPNEPEIAAALLRDALNDPASEVRRDACRRIAMTDPGKYAKYVSCVRDLLLSRIADCSANDSSRDVRREAERAYAVLSGDFAVAHGKLTELRSIEPKE